MGFLSSDEGMASTRSISAFFSTRPAADAARAQLVGAGLSFEAVKITDGRGTVTGRSTAAEPSPKPSADGLVETLKTAFFREKPILDAELSRAGYVLTAHLPADMLERAKTIIAREGEISDQA